MPMQIGIVALTNLLPQQLHGFVNATHSTQNIPYESSTHPLVHLQSTNRQ